MRYFMKLLRDGKGGTAIEYGLIVAMIVIVCISGISTLGGKVQSSFTNTSNALV